MNPGSDSPSISTGMILSSQQYLLSTIMYGGDKKAETKQNRGRINPHNSPIKNISFFFWFEGPHLELFRSTSWLGGLVVTFGSAQGSIWYYGTEPRSLAYKSTHSILLNFLSAPHPQSYQTSSVLWIRRQRPREGMEFAQSDSVASRFGFGLSGHWKQSLCTPAPKPSGDERVALWAPYHPEMPPQCKWHTEAILLSLVCNDGYTQQEVEKYSLS